MKYCIFRRHISVHLEKPIAIMFHRFSTIQKHMFMELLSYLIMSLPRNMICNISSFANRRTLMQVDTHHSRWQGRSSIAIQIVSGVLMTGLGAIGGLVQCEPMWPNREAINPRRKWNSTPTYKSNY